MSKESGFFDRFNIAIAIIPLIAYGLVFLYEQGYNSVFGLSNDFIEINVQSVLKSLAAMSILLVFVIATVKFYELHTLARKSLQNPFIRLFMSILYFVFLKLIFANTQESGAIPAFGIIFITVVLTTDFIMPIFSRWKVKGYLNKVAAAEDHQQVILSKDKTPNILGTYIAKLPGGIATYLFVFLFLIQGGFYLGQSTAMKRNNVYLTNGRKELVVKVLSDKILTAEIKDNKVQRSFKIYPLDGFVFTSEKYDNLQFPVVK